MVNFEPGSPRAEIIFRGVVEGSLGMFTCRHTYGQKSYKTALIR